MWAYRLLWCLVLVAISWVARVAESPASPASDDPAWEVSHIARSVQPGEVVLLTVRPPQPLERLQAQGLGTTFSFFPYGPEGEEKAWKGLVGIDLDVLPGNHELNLLGTQSEGGQVSASYILAVKSKRFPTRTLTVEENYVNPPAEELARIQREGQRVASIFEAVSPDRLWDESFLRPVPGPPTSNFGKRSIFNGQPRSPHGGMDFRAGEGTPVKAPNTGKVVLAANLYFAGNVVILDHGLGLYSYFAHLSRITASEGELVSKGAVVGHVGATGRVTGPHLHWSLRLSGARVDPLSLVAVLSGNQR
ncbi:MAG: hypothetical protein A3H27_07380 [Acidobacteria bacterium RIFCSPLOWO2_02_FULL_59_13]|nr:MAG: hypothetical protein A3H27_07380 [Acidobacteria bacterium RIFCSPLOWO2_02_FULL_59_13]